MTPLAIILIMASTLLHVGWNLLVKGRRSQVLFVGRILTAAAVVGLAPAVASELIARSMTPLAWWCALAAGVCLGSYFYALAHAYSMADFTVTYPVARALPVLMVAVADVALGRPVSALGWGAMALVVAGCVLAPLHSFHELKAAHYINRGTLWMVLAALATVGFTLFDKTAAESLRLVDPGVGSALRYGYFMYLGGFLTYRALFHGIHPAVDKAQGGGWALPVLAAVCTFSGYGLILWAYQLTRNASYVVAFRQVSIVIGVLLAFALYHERGRAVRITAAALITAGLVVIGVWGR